MKRIHLLHIAALVIAAILLLTSFGRAQNQPVYKSEPFVRELGLQIGKLPLTASGLQRAIQSLGDSGVVLISFPGVWDTAGVGAIPEGVTLKGWLFGQEVGIVNFEIDDSTGIAAFVEAALVGYATEEYVTTALENFEPGLDEVAVQNIIEDYDFPSKQYVKESVDSLKEEVDLKLFEDFTQYDTDTPENDDVFLFMDVNSQVVKRVTFSQIAAGEVDLSNYSTKAETAQSIDSVRTETETALGDKIDKDYTSYPGIPIPDIDAEIIIMQNDSTGKTTVDKLPVSDATQTALNGKQDALVSGTNIKTINSESILGSGNISVAGTVDTVSEDGIATKHFVATSIDEAVGETQDIPLSGGTTAQVLTKNSNADFDFGWADATGGSGVPQDSVDKKLYAEFNVEYPQATVPSVDNYIPVLTGTGNQYSALDDLPISSAVSSALSGKQDALGFTPEDVSNKSIDTTLGTSNALYPSQNAVKTYVDNAIETVNNEGDPRVPYMWVYLALDTIPSLTSFTPVTDAERSTVTESDVIGVNTYDVSYVSITLGGTDATYRTKTGETWSNWVNTWQLLKAVDSAQVRFTSSDSYEDALACTLVVGGEQEIFTVTTVAEILPDAPTGFEAEGGTSDTEIPMTWTDAVGGIDSVRIYEGSTNDTTAMTWIASVVQGTESYNRTGRTAETTYWYAVKSYDGSNESYFSNTDSATTTAGGGGSYPTDSLYEFWDAADLTNGSVTTWEGQIQPITLGLWDTPHDPEKTNDGVVFDSTDWMFVSNGKEFTEVSISWTGTIVDTSSFQIIAGIRLDDALITIQIFSDGILGVRAHDEGTDDVLYEVYNGGIINTTSNIIATYNGDGVVKVYVNGVERAMVSDYRSVPIDNNYIQFGVSSVADNVSEGTIFNEVMIYTKELTSQEVSDLWGYIESKYGL